DRNNVRDFPDRFRIAKAQAGGTVIAQTHGVLRDSAGFNLNHIFSQAGDLFFDFGPRAVADAHQGNERADANDNAKGGEHRTKFVSSQGVEGDASGVENGHGVGVIVGWACSRRRSSSRLSSRSVTGVSLSTRPSRMTRLRFA